ncbi:50S ribosomal protein L23 [Malacoplasma penetrans]|uniref:Large ribosomal subunit protein uL23 n=1 Tax=Malacoplasma penetrans (strain HF-2) TaxID=272633 RepID=Q8EUB5_MALP2|nr:50S ribosomal protein L23 [Malacoplasma penetrans]RXY96854.1 50S ribosomal protein L23 [Malacoplasma penetrans]BAC44801.1 ribosomal protein L23 [Malacoplasma penetrans HF-2]
MDLLSVIIKPLHSEKSYSLRNEDIKKYVFEVNRNANKYEISLAFQLIYGIVPNKVNVVNRKPTPTRTGTRNPGMTKAKKIAYITLPHGVDIQIDEEPSKEKPKKENKKELVTERKEEKKEKPKKGVLSKLVKTSPKAK